MKILLLTRDKQTARMLYHFLKDEHIDVHVVFEKKPTFKDVLRLKLRKYGILQALGQFLFLATIPRLLTLCSQKRVKSLCSQYHLDSTPIAALDLSYVQSVNHLKTLDTVGWFKPDLIVVHGTRILRSHIIRALSAPCVNIHAGYTPKYRGVHGGYWALYNNEPDKFGVTLHTVDAGVDTGTIIERMTFLPAKHDNYHTYPLIQFCEGLTLLKRFVERSCELSETESDDSESIQWSHPTLWTYLYGRIVYGVK